MAATVPVYLLKTSIPMLLLSALISYLLGCFNGAVLVSKYIFHDDIRTHGSGNAGLTNFYRCFGGVWTLGVVGCDVLKAMVSVWLSSFLLKIPVFPAYWGGLFCLLGHMFPFMFRFKGGKGILSGGVIAIMIDWRVALTVWGGFLILAFLTHYVSLGSLWAGISFPFASWFVFHNLPILFLAICIGGLLVWQHRGNIKRLIHGTENKFSLHKKGHDSQ